MSVTINQTPLVLTGKEYDLLVALASKAGQLVKRTAITGLLYSLDMEPDSNSLDVLLARLRRKLMGSGIEIETLRGKGFTLRVA
ncbi:winged helix-turn-helix domain-containing protein [Pseudomonas sp. MH9.2]|nr:winged helix-turn-helix domain-containing protein [Pseudomonas sp. MH9.2]MEB0024198.1 winged helix-turn-helix domain-containing protein [Pseudomonas sp. MH9.2]WPX67901.1 winged helix-turn-helix domain-containing protein [Pseudomonas sp. MH9.2]